MSLRCGCGIISVPLVTCVISNILARGCACNWPYAEQRCPLPREAWQPAAGGETPGCPFPPCLSHAWVMPPPLLRCRHCGLSPRTLWSDVLNFVRDKLCSSRCAVVQPIHSLSYHWRKAREGVELAEPVSSRTFNWEVMKVMKSSSLLPAVPWRLALGSLSLGGHWWAACAVPPVLHPLCCTAFVPCWAGEWQDPHSPWSARKTMAGQDPDEMLPEAEGPGEISGGSPSPCRGQSLDGEDMVMAKVYWYC